MSCPPPTFVQAATEGRMCQCCDPTLTHANAPFVSNNTQGNVIIAILAGRFNPGPLSQFTLTDSQGNAYNIVQSKTGTDSSNLEVGLIVWLATNIKAGANTVTVSSNPVVTVGDVTLIALEYNPQTTFPFGFDVGASAENQNATYNQVLNAGSVTPSRDVALLISAAMSSVEAPTNVDHAGPLSFDKATSSTGSGTAVTTPSATPAEQNAWSLFMIRVPSGSAPTFTPGAGWAIGNATIDQPFASMSGFEQITQNGSSMQGQATLSINEPEWSAILAMFSYSGSVAPQSGPVQSFSSGSMSGTTVIGTQHGVTPGDFELVFVSCNETGATISVSDGINTYTKVAEASIAGAYMALFLAPSVKVAGPLIGNGTGTLPISVTTNNTLTGVEIFVCDVKARTIVNLTENDAGAGWTTRQVGSIDGSVTLSVADRVVVANGTYTNDWLYQPLNNSISTAELLIAAFDANCSGPPIGGGIFRFQGSLQNMVGYKIEGVEIYVCNQPLTQQMQPTGPPPNFNVPPAPLATLFTDTSGKIQLANPVITDANGDFFFYAPVGLYTFVIYDKYNRIPNAAFANPTRVPVTVLPDMEVLIPAVAPSSITMVGDGVVLAPTVPATPTPNVAFTPAVATAPPNTVLAGPASGSPGPLTQRKLVGADLSAATGAAQGAVRLTGDLAPPSIAPLVVGTHLAANLPNSQGGRGNMAALGSINSPPTFDCAGNSSFTMTLSGNIASSSFTGAVKGQTYVFKITQDATGGRTFAWPAGFHGMSGVAPDAGITTVQEFLFDGTAMRAIGSGEVMA